MAQSIGFARSQLVDPSKERVEELSLRLPDAIIVDDTLRVGDGSYGEVYLKTLQSHQMIEMVR